MTKRLSKRFSMEKKPELSLEKLIELIKTPSFNRTSSDLLIMRNYFCQKIDYFKKLIQEPSGKDKVEKIISVLNYESFNKGEHIINFGDIGDKFYIVLSGIVGIYKPSPKNMDMTLKEYVDYLVRIRDWEKNMTKFERVQNYNSNIDKIKLLIINYNSSKLPYSNKKIPVIVEEERFIVKLGPGNSFGEMALIKNEPRNANIIAEEKCELVSIDKIDYRKIMKDIEEQKMNMKLKSFKLDYPFFKDWPANRCLRLLTSFVTENYNKDDYVYRQNSLANHIYIIKKGEFEVTSDINFSWYEDFINYIYNSSDSLINDMNDPLLWKEDNIQQKINSANENNKSPCILALPPISKVILSHRIDINQEDNEINKNDNSDAKVNENEINEVSKEENHNNYQNKIFKRINIQTLIAPQIFGYIEPFELKRRFCNIKCITREGVVQKIPFLEFLQLIPKDKKNIFFLEKNIFNRKKDIIEQLKNGTLAKLSFHYRKPCIKSTKIYPGRNMDKVPKKKPKIMIRSISTIRLNQNEKNGNLNNANNNSILCRTNNIKEFPIKMQKNIILGFKRSLFSSKNKVNSVDNFYPISLLSQKNRPSISVKKENKFSSNNSYSSMKFLEDYNNSSTALPTKSSLIPIYDSIGKKYANLSAEKIISKNNYKNDIHDFSCISNINKNTDISLPNIGKKKLENYSCKDIKYYNNDSKQNLKKFSQNLLSNNENEFNYLFN